MFGALMRNSAFGEDRGSIHATFLRKI